MSCIFVATGGSEKLRILNTIECTTILHLRRTSGTIAIKVDSARVLSNPAINMLMSEMDQPHESVKVRRDAMALVTSLVPIFCTH